MHADGFGCSYGRHLGAYNRGFTLFAKKSSSFVLFASRPARVSSFCSKKRAFSYVYSPALNAGVLRFVRGSLAPRCFFVLFPAVFRGFLSSFPRHRMPAFLCSVPLPVSRPLFLFCRMLSGLFVCLFPGIGCRCSSPSMER